MAAQNLLLLRPSLTACQNQYSRLCLHKHDSVCRETTPASPPVAAIGIVVLISPRQVSMYVVLVQVKVVLCCPLQVVAASPHL